MNIYEQRQSDQRRRNLYREAAAKKYGVQINQHAHVQPCETGAFVEINVWVPLAVIEPQPDPMQPYLPFEGL